MTTPQPVVRPVPGGLQLDVIVTPRASRAGIGAIRDGRLVVRVTAPPVDQAANDAVVEVVARGLGVPRRAVSISAGQRSRRKTLTVQGVTPAMVARVIGDQR